MSSQAPQASQQQRAESGEQRAQSRELRAESRDQPLASKEQFPSNAVDLGNGIPNHVRPPDSKEQRAAWEFIPPHYKPYFGGQELLSAPCSLLSALRCWATWEAWEFTPLHHFGGQELLSAPCSLRSALRSRALCPLLLGGLGGLGAHSLNKSRTWKLFFGGQELLSALCSLPFALCCWAAWVLGSSSSL
jgi:hypothetical protein